MATDLTGGGTNTGTGILPAPRPTAPANPLQASVTPDAGDLTGSQRDAFAFLTDLFTSYGLGTLAPAILKYIQEGYSSDTIAILLRETPEYKQRFAANDARIKAGLPALSPSEYLATETAYRQILRAAGLPSGFYDQNTDFQKFLENDVSPQEIQSRVAAASDFINSASAEQKALYSQWYTTGDMIAYALDPKRAAPLIEKSFAAAKVGGAATEQGLSIDQQMAESIVARGINAEQASQGFSMIQGTLANDQKLAAISGDSITAYDEMREVFFNDAAVAQKRSRLASQERGRFSGSSAIGTNSLSSTRSGQI